MLVLLSILVIYLVFGILMRALSTHTILSDVLPLLGALPCPYAFHMLRDGMVPRPDMNSILRFLSASHAIVSSRRTPSMMIDYHSSSSETKTERPAEAIYRVACPVPAASWMTTCRLMGTFCRSRFWSRIPAPIETGPWRLRRRGLFFSQIVTLS